MALGGVSVPTPYVNNGRFGFNLTAQVAVSNPNSISATLTSLKADVSTQNVPNVTIGSGQVSDVKINANTNTTVNFPLQVVLIDSQSDPNSNVVRDVTQSCGWSSGGSGSGSVTLNLKIDGRLSVLSLGIPIPITVPVTVQCPSLNDISSAITSLTGNAQIAQAVQSALSSGALDSSVLAAAAAALVSGGSSVLSGASSAKRGLDALAQRTHDLFHREKRMNADDAMEWATHFLRKVDEKRSNLIDKVHDAL